MIESLACAGFARSIELADFNQHPRVREADHRTVRAAREFLRQIKAAIAHENAVAIASAAKRLDELRSNWLNPPDLVDIVPEVVPGYPDRILPKNEKAAAELKKRTLTNLYGFSKPQSTLRPFFKRYEDSGINLPPLPGIFPDLDHGRGARRGADTFQSNAANPHDRRGTRRMAERAV